MRKVGFIPMTADGHLDEFLLAVKYPKIPMTQSMIQEALPALQKYFRCSDLPNKYKKTFTKAYNTLRGIGSPTKLTDLRDDERSAIQAYVATGHPVSGKSMMWIPAQKEFVEFDTMGVGSIGEGMYVLP